MDLKQLSSNLKEFDQREVGVYVNYVKSLLSDQKTMGWANKITLEQYTDIYKKVSIDNLYIDGETITLGFKGKLMADYNYQAYKNKMLNAYPETKFDLQNVYEGDVFNFLKQDGKVHYTHKIIDPFATKRTVIGCYCIIKNSKGEFLETLNMTEINKMKSVAKTDAIWNKWFEEMTLKSVIKRACKRHFKDKFSNIEKIDNENYDLETDNVGHDIKKMIDECSTEEELQTIYRDHKDSQTDEAQFIKLLSDRKSEIKKSVQ